MDSQTALTNITEAEQKAKMIVERAKQEVHKIVREAEDEKVRIVTEAHKKAQSQAQKIKNELEFVTRQEIAALTQQMDKDIKALKEKTVPNIARVVEALTAKLHL